MFEILRALVAMKDASDENGNGFWWEITNSESGTPVLKIEVSLSEADVEFYEQFKELVGP